MEQWVPSVPPTCELKMTLGLLTSPVDQSAVHEPWPPTFPATNECRWVPAGQVAPMGHEQLVPLQQFGPQP